MYEELISDLRKGYTDRIQEAADAIEKLETQMQEAKEKWDSIMYLVEAANNTIELATKKD